MAIPPNISAATAVSLNPLPQSLTLDVNDSGTTHTVWYTYTATATDNMIGLHFYGDATYIPQTGVYWPTATDLHLVNVAATVNRPFQIPVTAGETYYFKVESSTGTVGTALLHIAAEAFTDQAVPTGSLAINDDKTGFPLDLLSATDAHPIRYVQGVAAGPTGTTLPDGHLLLYDAQYSNTRITFYTPQFLPILTVALMPNWHDFVAIGSNRADTFYAGVTSDEVLGSAVIRSYSPLGVLGQTWVLPDGGMRTLEAANDDTVAYFTQDAPGPILRWDLVADSALSDLAAADGTGHSVIDLLVLGDDTVLALYQVTSMGDTFAKRYSPSGTLLNTYPFGDLWEPRVASALDDPASFWLYRKPLEGPGDPSGVAYFLQIRVSDGATLATIGPTYLFPQGTYRGDDALTPPARFGIATSCPFWIVRVAMGGGGGGGGGATPPEVAPSYHLDARYIRRLRRAPHLAQENQRVFYRRFELDLERGQGLATGQGTDPMVLLRISRDGGQTWGEEQRMAAGKLGAYTQRVIARRLGQARDTVFEVVVSDPIGWSLVGAWLDLEPGTN